MANGDGGGGGGDTGPAPAGGGGGGGGGTNQFDNLSKLFKALSGLQQNQQNPQNPQGMQMPQAPQLANRRAGIGMALNPGAIPALPQLPGQNPYLAGLQQPAAVPQGLGGLMGMLGRA